MQIQSFKITEPRGQNKKKKKKSRSVLDCGESGWWEWDWGGGILLTLEMDVVIAKAWL